MNQVTYLCQLANASYFFSQLMTLCIVQDDFVNMEHTCRYTCIEMQQEYVDIQKIRKKRKCDQIIGKITLNIEYCQKRDLHHAANSSRYPKYCYILIIC